ncbi:uncharacterized protein LOC144923703 isoform X2 [Branchiostoma floridae x Branchiostoma belcheri]
MGDNAVDKVDMSLDDIIKQNRKEKREAARQGRNKKVTKLIGKPGARAALAVKAVRGRGRGARGAGTSARGAGRGVRRGGAAGRGGRGRGGGAGVARLNRQGGAQQTGASRPQNQRSQLNSLRKQKLQQARQRLQQQQQRQQQQQNRQNKQFQNRGLQQPQQQRGRGRGRGGGRGRGQLNRRGALQGYQGNRQQQQQQQQNRRKWNNTPRGPPPTHILTVSVPNPLAKGAAGSQQKNQGFSRGFNNAGNKGGFKTLSDRFSATQQAAPRGQQVRGRGGRRGRGGGRGRGRGGAMGRMVTLH